MSRVCQLTGKRTSVGNNVSHSVRRTKRKFFVNLFWRNIKDRSEIQISSTLAIWASQEIVAIIESDFFISCPDHPIDVDQESTSDPESISPVDMRAPEEIAHDVDSVITSIGFVVQESDTFSCTGGVRYGVLHEVAVKRATKIRGRCLIKNKLFFPV